MKLVVDSASDIRKMEDIEDIKVVPITLITENKEYRDDENLDVMAMVEDFENSKSPSRSACPAAGDYAEALEDAKEAIIVTLASPLSGSYNSAYTASVMYMEENKDATVKVVDSNGVGPQEKLVVEKFVECDKKGMNATETFEVLTDYVKNHLRIGYALKSLKNLANNGRISPFVAKIADAIGIRVVGIFSEWGEIQPTNKLRGELKSIQAILANMKKDGYKGGKVIIDHCDAIETAKLLEQEIKKLFSEAIIKIGTTTGLCSFYAERGGIIVAYEM